MSDVFTKRERSEVMSRIRGRGNKDTELALAKLLGKNGIKGWRRQLSLRFTTRTKRNVGGHRRAATVIRPDFIFPKARVAVFVDGCFWHGCPIHSKPSKWLKKSSMEEEQKSGVRIQNSVVRERCTTGYQIRTGKQFWREKMAANIARDRFVNRELRKQGWKVVRIWEHELRGDRSQKSEFRRQKAVERIRRAVGGDRSQESEVRRQKARR